MRRAASALVAEALLIAIVVAAGFAVYALVVNRGVMLERGASISISDAKIQVLGNGLALLTVSLTNTGSVPELAGIYVSGLGGGFADSVQSGYLYVTYSSLPGGTYYFIGASEAFVYGPSTGYSWEQVQGKIQLSSGNYGVAVYSLSRVKTNMPSSTLWLVSSYSLLRGNTLSINGEDPVNLSAFGAVITGESLATGSSPSYSQTTGVQPGIPAGLLAAGQTEVFSIMLSGNYSVGQSVAVVAEAWTASGSTGTASEAAVVS